MNRHGMLPECGKKEKKKKNKPWNVFSEDSEIHDLCLLYLLFEKSQSLKPKMKRNRTYILHIRCYLQSLILICLFLSYSLYPDLKEKPLENLQWSIDPGADLAQYKMDVTVIDTKVSHRFATGQHAP